MSPRKPPPPPQEGLLDLLGGPTPEAVVERPDPLWGAINVKWMKPPAGRHLCQDCVDLIHGREGGTSPLVATARRHGPNDDRLLCAAHAQMRRDEDDRAKRQHDQRVASGQAAQKAVLTRKGYGPRREHA